MGTAEAVELRRQKHAASNPGPQAPGPRRGGPPYQQPRFPMLCEDETEHQAEQGRSEWGGLRPTGRTGAAFPSGLCTEAVDTGGCVFCWTPFTPCALTS